MPNPVCDDYQSPEHCMMVPPWGLDDNEMEEWTHQCALCFGGDPCDDCMNPDHPEYMLLECCYPYGGDSNYEEPEECDGIGDTGEQCADGTCQTYLTMWNDCMDLGDQWDDGLEWIDETVDDVSDWLDDAWQDVFNPETPGISPPSQQTGIAGMGIIALLVIVGLLI